VRAIGTDRIGAVLIQKGFGHEGPKFRLPLLQPELEEVRTAVADLGRVL
jgi:hypothetical protein